MQRNVKAALVSATLGGAAIIAAHFVTIPSEGDRYHAYLDGGKIPTICKGHTEGVYMGMVATPAQCQAFFIQDMNKADKIFDQLIYPDDVPENVKAAALDFIFNVGQAKFRTSTLRKKLNTKDYLGSCSEYPKWKMQGPLNCELAKNAKICGGLPVRRQKEKSLCLDQTKYDNYDLGVDGIIYGVKNGH